MAQNLDELRQIHLGRLLLEAQRGFSENFIRRLRASNPRAERVSSTHVTLIANIPMQGARMTELAAKVSMTKQSVGQLVRDMEETGLLERADDPTDRRAAIVRFSASGRQLMRDSLTLKDEIEAEYRALLGDQAFESLLRSLAAIIAHEKHPA